MEQCRVSGQQLMKICGEPDKPEVKKHIEDLDNAWDNITALFAKREENLINAMEKAMEFHETLQVERSFFSFFGSSYHGRFTSMFCFAGYFGFPGASGEHVREIRSVRKRHRRG